MNLRPAINALQAAGVADPAGDARRLFDWAYALGQGGEPQDRDAPNATTRAIFDRALTARQQRQPVSHITGRRAFWKHEFIVTPDVLDPRPETETLVEHALSLPFSKVLDLGTGSGAILFSLLADRPEAQGVGSDMSPEALDVALRNADALQVVDRVQLVTSDWFDNIEGQFDLIVSNPPYIAALEMPDLSPEVRDWEPHLALSDGADGLTAYRAITAQARTHLKSHGHLAVEIGPSQGAAVRDMFTAGGLIDVAILPDLDQRDRVVTGRRPG